MKCPKCGKNIEIESSVNSRIYICPYCGVESDSSGHLNTEMKDAILKIKDMYGMQVMSDATRVNALLMDLAPHMTKERKLIVTLLKEGVILQLEKISKVENNKDFEFNKLVNRLAEDTWLSENIVSYALKLLIETLNFDIQPMECDEKDANEVQSDNSSEILLKQIEPDDCDDINTKLKKYNAIGYKAFSGRLDLIKVIVPNNITEIYPKAFYYCTELQEIEFPSSVNQISVCAFEGCSSLSNIILNGSESYKVIKDVLIDKKNKKTIRALNKREISLITIVNGIEEICRKTFEYCACNEIHIPASVSRIDEFAFYRTFNLEQIKVERHNKIYQDLDGVLHNRNASYLIKYPPGRKNVSYYLEDDVEVIGKYSFSCAQYLQNITFSSKVNEIGKNAFEYCINIDSLMLPSSIRIIGERAFQYCSSMKNIMLPRSIQEIGDFAFYNCSKLESITIPQNVSRIGNQAFAGCEKLKKIIIQDGVNFIGDGAFVSCDELEVSIRNNDYVERYCVSHGIKINKI